MKLKNILLAVSFPVAFSLACGGKSKDPEEENASAPPSSSAGKKGACENFCEQISSCGGTNKPDCVEFCTEDKGLSRMGQDAINKCFDAELCEFPTEESFGLGLICILNELDGVKLSDEAETYCSESVGRINQCLGSEPETKLATCEDSIAVVSDEFLADLNDCANKDCKDVEACVFVVALRNAPLEQIFALEEGENPSPQVIASLIPFVTAFSQLGFEDDGSFDDIFESESDTSSEMDRGGN